MAVRFTPPDAAASEIGTSVDGTAGTNDVVAGIVDLAVRGWYRRNPTGSVGGGVGGGGGGRW